MSSYRSDFDNSHGQDDHTDSLAFFNGREALDLSNFRDAAHNFTLLIERHPRDPQYFWLRAKAYYGMKAWKLCLSDCEKAMELGLEIEPVKRLIVLARAEDIDSEDEMGRAKPDLMALLALRHNYRLRSLFITADEHLAEGDYNAVLDLVNLAERLLDTGDSSGELAFNLGLLRVKGCIGAGRQGEALEVIDFYIKHAHLASREDFVGQFKELRALLY